VDTALFDYNLPPSAIAQSPTERRDHARLLVFERASGRIAHHRFHELPDLLATPHALYRNNAAVLPARLFGSRPGGGLVECLLLEPAAEPAGSWWCLLRPGRRLQPGKSFTIGDTTAMVVAHDATTGRFLVNFQLPAGLAVTGWAAQIGRMPLPPYIQRAVDDPRAAADRERYQTVYADAQRTVAAAAPTAGLHFTPQLIDTLAAHGHLFHDLTLHVGLGTFRPIQSVQIEDHPIHTEVYEIPATTVASLQAPPGGPPARPRLAVGTTALRTLEHWARHQPAGKSGTDPAAVHGVADIYIYPPATFFCDALITNFHLPKSTLMCLVAAFLAPGSTAGIDRIQHLYATALGEGYRFYSYGDAMLIL
jgi:S-adenosylmethionine:tRNA ribosyltransferase-isomerase